MDETYVPDSIVVRDRQAEVGDALTQTIDIGVGGQCSAQF